MPDQLGTCLFCKLLRTSGFGIWYAICTISPALAYLASDSLLPIQTYLYQSRKSKSYFPNKFQRITANLLPWCFKSKEFFQCRHLCVVAKIRWTKIYAEQQKKSSKTNKPLLRVLCSMVNMVLSGCVSSCMLLHGFSTFYARTPLSIHTQLQMRQRKTGIK